VAGDVGQHDVWVQGLDGGVDDAADQGGGLLAQQPLDVRDADEPAGGHLGRRPAHVDLRGQGG
jgi:hypothetical protein